MPVLERYWRYHAKSFAYPQPWAFPGKVIRRLLEHIEALEAQQKHGLSPQPAPASPISGDTGK